MFEATIPANELFNEETSEIIHTKQQTIKLEHSLVSLSKWESKYCKPFLTKEQKTPEEMLDYIRFMTITQNVDDNIYLVIPENIVAEIFLYIDSKQTATTFSEDILNKSKKKSNEIITNELIYYWMFSLEIPKECEKWHLNRLLTLIRIFNVKSEKPKKMSKSEILAQNRALNAKRRKALNSKG